MSMHSDHHLEHPVLDRTTWPAIGTGVVLLILVAAVTWMNW